MLNVGRSARLQLDRNNQARSRSEDHWKGRSGGRSAASQRPRSGCISGRQAARRTAGQRTDRRLSSGPISNARATTSADLTSQGSGPNLKIETQSARSGNEFTEAKPSLAIRIRPEIVVHLPEVTFHEARLIPPAQARPQPDAIEAGDYARDFSAVHRQKIAPRRDHERNQKTVSYPNSNPGVLTPTTADAAAAALGRSAKKMTDEEPTYPRVPAQFVPAVLAFPECSYGAVRATLVLKDGRAIFDVILGGDAIAKVGDKLVKSAADLDFATSDIVKVLRG
jgi:hypothetical protein